MERTLTLVIPDELYEPLLQVATARGTTPEELAAEWLAAAVALARQDPLEPFIGAFRGEIPNWADEHDHYLGAALYEAMHDRDNDAPSASEHG